MTNLRWTTNISFALVLIWNLFAKLTLLDYLFLVINGLVDLAQLSTVFMPSTSTTG